MEAVLDDNGKFLQSYQAMLPESSSNKTPVTYVSKPWHHKKLTLKTALISNCDHVVDCLDLVRKETVADVKKRQKSK